MEDVRQTKFRLVQEAVQENVHPGARVDVYRPPSFRRLDAAARWLWTVALAALVVLVAYIAVPLPVASTADIQSAAETPAADAASFPQEPEALIPERLDRALFPLPVRKIVLDPGHGGSQDGAISESGVAEKQITLEVAFRLQQLLQDAGFEVLMTRETDEHVSLGRRAQYANAERADLFVSIHVNWVEPRTQRPVETYFLGPSSDPDVTRTAAIENQASGYSLADYRSLLDEVYLDTRRDESQRLARIVHTSLFGSLRQVNPELHDRGVKMAPFVVLTRTEMPSILVEISSMSNEDEVQLIKTTEYQEHIAQALLKGIRAYARDIAGTGGTWR